MNSNFNSERYFYANNGWYILMRPGDELHRTYSGLTKVTFTIVDGITIAGPFKTKKISHYWFKGFLSLWGHKRNTNSRYIPDSIMFSDRNSIYL